MRYLIWVISFVTYVLMWYGIFVLILSFTRGVTVEANVKRVVYGEEIIRRQEVEFIEVPAVKWIFGMTTLFITMSTGYAVANFMSNIWSSYDERKQSFAEKLIRRGSFTIIFFVFSFVFKVYGLAGNLNTNMLLFMVATCAGAYITSAVLCKLAGIDTDIIDNGGTFI